MSKKIRKVYVILDMYYHPFILASFSKAYPNRTSAERAVTRHVKLLPASKGKFSITKLPIDYII